MAPTWRQRQMGYLKSWGSDSLNSFCLRFCYVPKKTSKSIPISDIPSILFVHPSKPCSFHDSLKVVMIRMPPVHAWCPRYRPTYSFGFIPLAHALATRWADSPTSATSFFQARPDRLLAAVKPSLPILKKLITSAAITSIHFMMEWDSTIFPTCASRGNFKVGVCHFTSRKADSATPFAACSPIGLSHKTNSTKGDANDVAMLRATIDGSPSLYNIARR